MLQQIQNYLFQYKTVTVPEVGTFEVTHSPATLDVANQLISPPMPAIRFSQSAAVSGHQLQTFAAALDNDVTVAEKELIHFGGAFKKVLEQESFQWNGVGVLALMENNQVQFSANDAGGLLMPVPAQKVLRENVQHNVLVGDQEVQYTADEFEAGLPEPPARSWLLAICLVIVACAVAFIVYYLYVHNWSAEASGLRQKATIQASPQQHQ